MGKKILLVDDEELLIRSFSKLLEKKGFEVYTVKDGANAIALCEEESFDMVISDIRMPGENGVDTVSKIRKLLHKQGSKDVPIIFITGYADTLVEKQAKDLKPIAYLQKPFDVNELILVIEKSLKA